MSKKRKPKPSKNKLKSAELVRCCMCMVWQECTDGDDYSYNGIWMCEQCRRISQQLTSVQNQLQELLDSQKTNAELMNRITFLNEECASLITANCILEQQLHGPPKSTDHSDAKPEATNSTHPVKRDILLVGSSHLRRLKSLTPKTTIHAKGGGVIEDSLQILRSYEDNSSR